MTHEEAAKLYAKARNPLRGKPLENNTYLVKRGDDYAVRFHNTDVVTIHADGTYTLATDGWYSKTTAERINTYSPARIILRGEKFYIARNPNELWYPGPLKYERTVGWGERQPVTPENRAYYAAVKAWKQHNNLPFADGVRVNAKGRVIDTASLPAEAPVQTTAAWGEYGGRSGWSEPVPLSENKARHKARLDALLGDFRARYAPEPEHMVQFGDLDASGTLSNVRFLPQSAMQGCPHFIMVPEHYRADNTCKCNDPNDPDMAEWGYTWDATTERWT